MPSTSRLKKYRYTVTYEVEAINLDKAHAKTQDIDERVLRTGARKTGEARLTGLEREE